MPNQSIEKTVADWEVLYGRLASEIAAMPHIVADRDALQALIAELNALDMEQELHKGALRETNQKRKELLQSGREVIARLAAALRARFGPKSEQLIRYGVKPQPREIHRRFLSKEEKARRLAEEAARAAAEAEAEKRLREVLKAVNDNLPAKTTQVA